MRTAAICVVKDYETRISEWIAYQLAVGFDTIILLDNGSTDGTRAKIEAFAGQYDVRLFDWLMTGIDYQRRAYEWALWRHAGEFTWCACIDADEFPCFPEGGSVGEVLSGRSADTSVVTMPWAMFGSNGHIDTPNDLVIRSYLRRHDVDHWDYHHVKSIVRPRLVEFAHNSHHFSMTSGDAVDLGGQIITMEALRHTNPDFSFGQLNHYFTQSRADWLIKLSRGYHDTKRNEADFAVYDTNDVLDTSALSYASRVEAILSSVQATPRPCTLDLQL